MAFPSKLKNFNLFNDGNNYQGQVAEIDLPKLTRKTEDWRGAGMGGAVKVDMGQEAMQMEWTVGGMMRGILEQWGVTKHNAVMLRFAGAYQAEDSDTPDAVEVVVRGRHSEIDMGKAKAGDETSMKITTQLTYYKLSINGEDIIEIDMIAMIEKVGGIDRLAAVRQAIGL
jgi:P2 family phage contractile tail tube protein